MKFIIDNWYLIFVALASGSMLLWPALKSASGGSLTPARAVQLINREKAVVIDVCETEEYAAGHVGGAGRAVETVVGDRPCGALRPLGIDEDPGDGGGVAVAPDGAGVGAEDDVPAHADQPPLTGILRWQREGGDEGEDEQRVHAPNLGARQAES